MSKYPSYIQRDAQDNGLTCIRMIAKYYGKTISSDSLRNSSSLSHQTPNLLSVSHAADGIGLRTNLVRVDFGQLGDFQLPCIIGWKQTHFIVVYKIAKNKIYISDPAFGTTVYDKNTFLDGWLASEKEGGEVLLVQPTPVFYDLPEEENKISFSFFLSYLKPFKRYYLQLMLGMLVGLLIALITPFLTQSIVDVGINNQSLNFIQIALAAQLMLVFSSTVIGLIRSWLFLHISSRISIAVISDYLIKLMKLPIVFFENKKVGDMMQRIGDHSRLQNFISVTTLNTLFSFINFVGFGVIMAYYNLKIFVIFLIGSLLYGIWVSLFMSKRKELDNNLFEQNSQRQTTLIQLLTGIKDIKLHSIEKQKRWELERLQVRGFKINMKQMALGQYQQFGGVFIDQAKNITISYISAKAVMDGEMTFGMMLSLQFILGQLNAPVSQLIGLINSYQDAKISFDRISEVQNKKEEEVGALQRIPVPSDHTISIDKLSYSYEGTNGKKALDDITLKIPHGKVTAIVGASGSGKTTLLKLLLKFYDGYQGKITVGNVNLSNISHKLWRLKCGTVMQDATIFSDTIAANIALDDEIINIDKLNFAAQLSNVLEFIESLPLGYSAKLGPGGTGISMGQKQRILIARAVYRDPEFLFFDEATNALDTKNEKTIVENLNKFFGGRTVVVIAHRLTTVKNADQIVVINDGRITETGVHHELVAKKGMYYELVKNQLELNT